MTTSIEHLFPLTFTITQEIINRSLPLNSQLCQGALALREALGEWANGRIVTWGIKAGFVDNLPITTQERESMPLITSPTKVTFILSE